jgi:hypothetical protein
MGLLTSPYHGLFLHLVDNYPNLYMGVRPSYNESVIKPSRNTRSPGTNKSHRFVIGVARH